MILVSIALIFFSPVSSWAVPNWIKTAILNSEDIQPDEDAPAVILYNYLEIRISENGSAEQKVRKVIKNLFPDGTDRTTCHEMINSSRAVSGLRGWCVRSNGSVEKLDKENIYQIGIAEAGGYYSDNKTIYAMFPEVNSGDVVGYEYTVKNDKGFEGFFQGFLIQESLPVNHSMFTVITPRGWNLDYSGYNIDSIEYHNSENVHHWSSGYLSYQPDEPYMPSWDDVTRYIYIHCYDGSSSKQAQFNNWASVREWVYGLSESQVDTDNQLKASAAKIILGAKLTEEKIRRILHYVRDEIRHVAVEIGIGRFQPRRSTLTLQNRYGDCKDKTTLARAMLKEIGVEAIPVLARAKGNLDTAFASPFQFDHMLLAILLDINSELGVYTRACAANYLFFDPTDLATPLGLLPQTLYGTYVLPVDSKPTSLVQLPPLSPENYRRRNYASVQLNPDYSISANITITDYAIWGMQSAHYYKTETADDQHKNIEQLFSSIIANPVITDYEYNITGDSTTLSYKISSSGYPTVTGDLLLCKADIFHADDKRKLKKNKDRCHSVFFGDPAIVETMIEWHVPEAWCLVEIPDKISSTCDRDKFTGEVDTIGGVIYIKSNRYFSGNVIPVEKYEIARKFEAKINSFTRLNLLFRMP